jgi:hypothetical protein
MTMGLAGGLVHARAVGPKAREAGWVVGSVTGSGGGLEGDLVAERLELADEAAGSMLGRVASCEPVGTELAVGDAVADDVVVGDEDVVAGRPDRFGLSAAAADLPVVGGDVAVLGAGGAAGGVGQGLAQPGVAVAGLAGAALGAGLGGAGAVAAQETKCPQVGKTLLSRPHSAISTSAV